MFWEQEKVKRDQISWVKLMFWHSFLRKKFITSNAFGVKKADDHSFIFDFYIWTQYFCTGYWMFCFWVILENPSVLASCFLKQILELFQQSVYVCVCARAQTHAWIRLVCVCVFSSFNIWTSWLIFTRLDINICVIGGHPSLNFVIYHFQ